MDRIKKLTAGTCIALLSAGAQAAMEPMATEQLRQVDGQAGVLLENALEARSSVLLARSLANSILSEVIDDDTGLAGYIDRRTGLETLIDVNTGLGAYIDRNTGLETYVDLQTGLGRLIDIKTGPSGWMLDAIDRRTGLAGYIDRRTGLETLIDVNTGLGAVIDRNTGLGSFDLDLDLGFGILPLG